VDPSTELDREERALMNLYPGALPHVADWAPGRLEARSHVAWSSQALCVSVWGTIAESVGRSAILGDVLAAAGVELDLGAGPQIECEVRGHRDVLCEFGGANPTCPDVLIRGPGAVLTVESKFTEYLGGCSQAKANAKRSSACSGNYERGSDLRTKTDAPCRLTVQERNRTPRRYWEVGKGLFRPEVVCSPRRPCPFRDGHYQLMRNLCFAAALGERESRPHAGLLVAYVGGARAASANERTFAEFRAMLLLDVSRRVGAIRYEQIATIVGAHGETTLATWIDGRLRAGVAAGRT
jgi:hypothetical protein